MQKSGSKAIKRLVGNQKPIRQDYTQLISLNIGAKEHGTVIFLKTDKNIKIIN